MKKDNGKKTLSFKIALLVVLIIVLSSVFGFAAGLASLNYYPEVKDYLSKWGVDISFEQNTSTVVKENTVVESKTMLKQEELVTKAVKEISPSVVSIVITKDMPVYEKYYFSPFGDLRFPKYQQE